MEFHFFPSGIMPFKPLFDKTDEGGFMKLYKIIERLMDDSVG